MGRKKTSMKIDCLKQPNSNTTTNMKSQIPNIMNEHFTGIGPTLANNLPTPKELFTEFLDKSKSPATSFFFCPISPNEVKLEILSMSNNKSYGFYSCPVSILKHASDIISDVLTKIFNKSIDLGTFPSKLKMAKVIPIFKSDDNTDPNNYRPISLLSCFNRIFEKLVYKRMKSFIEEKNILCTSQYGFRQGHSTEHAILDIVSRIQSNMDAGAFSCGVFIDLKKAFDTVDHSILLHKLDFYGFRGIINVWFRSYLQDRTQITVIDQRSSNKSSVTYGVPQGSVLGPLLFLLYVNDIYSSSNKLNFYLFADDTNILYSHKNLKSLENVMNFELNNVFQWLTSNKLKLNQNKSNFVIFRPYKKRLPFAPKICILDHQTNTLTYLECKECVKYLGVLIDYKLSWKNHVDSIAFKISKTVGLLSKLRHFVPHHTLVNIYNSLITPYLRYGLIVWGQASKTDLNKLLILQKRALRFIYFSDRRDHAIPLFLNAHILPINFMYYKLLAETMHDVSNDLVPSNLKDLFVPTAKIHSYKTRASVSKNFYIQKSNTEIKRKSFSRIGAKLWNEIPTKLRALPKATFKKKIQMILLNILENEDSYKDLESIISKLHFYSS